jgi:hypothetical protein
MVYHYCTVNGELAQYTGIAERVNINDPVKRARISYQVVLVEGPQIGEVRWTRCEPGSVIINQERGACLH